MNQMKQNNPIESFLETLETNENNLSTYRFERFGKLDILNKMVDRVVQDATHRLRNSSPLNDSEIEALFRNKAVSYTHLTLPTICSV